MIAKRTKQVTQEYPLFNLVDLINLTICSFFKGFIILFTILNEILDGFYFQKLININVMIIIIQLS